MLEEWLIDFVNPEPIDMYSIDEYSKAYCSFQFQVLSESLDTEYIRELLINIIKGK